MTAFFIIRDITEQKRVEEERALEEERYNIALRNTYTEIYEIDLSADTPHLVYAADTPMIPVDHDKNGNIHTIAATLIHPEDRERFLTAFIGSNIRKEFSEGRMEVPAEYRRTTPAVPTRGYSSSATSPNSVKRNSAAASASSTITPCATSTTSCTN